MGRPRDWSVLGEGGPGPDSRASHAPLGIRFTRHVSEASGVSMHQKPLRNTKIDFLDFPVVKTPSSSVGDVGLIPGQRSKISHAMEQLSLQQRSQVPQLGPNAAK